METSDRTDDDINSREHLPMKPSSAGTMFGALTLGTALVVSSLVPASLSASRDEVLSDLDCVVEPSMVVELSAASSGLLSETYYQRSDFVSGGTLMASLESRVEHARLEIAEEVARSQTAIEQRLLSVDFGERTLQRNRQLLQQAAISEQSLDQMDTETRIARLQLEQERDNRRLALLEVAQARAQMNRTRVVTPISGTVTRRYKSAGEYVDGEPIYQIAQLDPLHVEVIVPVDYLGQLSAGMAAGVILDAPGFDQRSLSATIRTIDAVPDAASATYGVRLLLPNPDLTVPAGVRCQIDFFSS